MGQEVWKAQSDRFFFLKETLKKPRPISAFLVSKYETDTTELTGYN